MAYDRYVWYASGKQQQKSIPAEQLLLVNASSLYFPLFSELSGEEKEEVSFQWIAEQRVVRWHCRLIIAQFLAATSAPFHLLFNISDIILKLSQCIQIPNIIISAWCTAQCTVHKTSSSSSSFQKALSVTIVEPLSTSQWFHQWTQNSVWSVCIYYRARKSVELDFHI